MPPIIQPDPTTEEVVQQAVDQARNTLYFDMGAGLAGTSASGLTSGLWTTNGALGGLSGSASITIADIQNSMSQIAAITAGPPSTLFSVGVDTACHSSRNGITVVNVPAIPPHEAARVFYPRTAYVLDQHADVYGFSQIPQEVFQYQAQLNSMINWYSGAMLGNAFGTMGRRETTEERIARETREVKRRAERSAAEKRAEQLLFTILKPQQVRQYQDYGYFETEVDDRIYRIHKRGHSQNVELIVKGKAVAKYCVHPQNCYETPIQDTMIAQLLALKHDEAHFLKTANKTIIYG